MFNEILPSESQSLLEQVNHPFALTSTDLITPHQLPQPLQSNSFNDLETVQHHLEGQLRSSQVETVSNDLLTGQTLASLDDNTPATARNITVNQTLKTYTDWVGDADPVDIYRFTLTNTSAFGLLLRGLSDDNPNNAAVQLYDGEGTLIAETVTGGLGASAVLPGLIGQQLEAGTYYLGVAPFDGDTGYHLTAGAISIPVVPSDRAGNTPESARQINVGSTLKTYTDWVGSTDPKDYYRFTLNDSGSFGLLLNGLSKNADVKILGSDRTTVVASSSNIGTKADYILLEQMNPGTYYIAVDSNNRNTYYDLTVGAVPPLSIQTIRSASDNTLATAQNIRVGTKLTTYTDSVGSTDRDDYYRFTIGKDSNFVLTLNGLTNNADVELLNSNGSLITRSRNSGIIPEKILQELEDGTYYVRVRSFSGNTSYNLMVGAIPVPLNPPDSAGNTLSKAKKINVGSTLQTYTDWIGSTDPDDYYRFSLKDTSVFSLFSYGLSDNVNVEILDSDGFAIARDDGLFVPDDSVIWQLDAGTYYVRISPEGNDTPYGFTVGAIGADPADYAGNTADSARKIDVSSTSITLADWVGSTDPDDYYQFSLEQTSNFNLLLNGLSGDAGVELRNSNGNIIALSNNQGTTAESLSLRLNAGTYYIHVLPDLGNAFYNLTVSTNTPDPTFFNSNYGYGLVNAAAAVARAIGRPTFADVDDLGGYNWGNDLIHAPEVWEQGYTGQNTTVAVIDFGVDIDHTAFEGKIWMNPDEIPDNGIDDDGNGYIDDINGWNLADDNNNVRPTSNDAEGAHGTVISGIIAGVAPDTKIMSLKVPTSSEREQLAEAINYAVNNGADVISISLLTDESSVPQDALTEALANAASRNVIVVMAAGNDGLASPRESPEKYADRYGIAVGAVDRNSKLAFFSDRAGSDSNMQYVVAPGVSIASTVPGDNYYDGLFGTSFAAPYVAGVVALMLSANPNLTHEQVRDYVTSTATVLA